MANDKKIQITLELQNGQYIAKVRESSKETEKFKKKSEEAAKGISAGFSMIKVAIAAAVAAIAGKLLQLGGEFDDVKTSFDKLTAGIEGGSEGLLKSIQTAAKGTVSQLEIMKSSNLAITLMGENVAEYLPRMMEIARSTAATQGVSVAQMYNDIIVASGRQSVMILDNLGISSVTAGKYMEEYARKLGKTRDQLNDTQKRAAFFYAVMKAGGDITNTVGADTLTFGQKLQVITAGLTDIATNIVDKIHPELLSLGDAFISVVEDGGIFTEFLAYVTDAVGYFIRKIQILIDVMNQINTSRKRSNLQTTARLEEAAQRDMEAALTQKYGSIAKLKEQAKIKGSQAEADFNKLLDRYAATYKANSDLSANLRDDIAIQQRIVGDNLKNKDFRKEVVDARRKQTARENKNKNSGNSADDAKLYKKQLEYLQSFRQVGMSEWEIIQDNHDQELAKFNEITDEKLKKTKEYAQAREAIEKQHQDNITNYIISKTTSWLGFASDAIGSIGNLYNMASQNRIAKLDEEYAAQVEAVNNSVLSEEAKENRLAMLEADYEAKKKKEQLRNAKTQKKIALLQAMVDLPASVVATFRNMGGWPWGVIPAAIMTGIGLKQIQMIKDQPVSLASGGIATNPTLAMIGDNKNYKEAVTPLSPAYYKEVASGIEAARSRNASSNSVTHNYDNRVTVQGDIIDKDGFNDAVYKANREIERRSGLKVYSR